MAGSSLHPFTILAVAAAVVATTTAAGIWWISAAVITGCLVLAIRAHCARKLVLLSCAIILPAFTSQLLIHAVAATHGTRILLAAGPVTITAEGLGLAAALGLRTAVLVVAGILCALLIDRHQLVAAIDLSKAPPQLGYLVAATLFLLPQLAGKQHAIGQAQQLRGVDAGWFQRLRLRSVPLVLGSLQDAAIRAPHLAARGFPATGSRTRWRTVPDSPCQRRIRYAAVACTLLGPLAILAPVWMGA